MTISKYALKNRARVLRANIIELGMDTDETLDAWIERHCAETKAPVDPLGRRAAEVALLENIFYRRKRMRVEHP